jgi:hypothetical protein
MNKTIKISTTIIAILIIIFILALLSIYISLINGLNINNIDYKNIHINKLYIKIDKKLIINANNIKISTKNDNIKTNYSEINNIIKNNFLYLNYFQKISIKNIQINNTKINFLSFFDNKLEVDTNLAYLKASFIPKHTKIAFLIHKITYKPMNITLENIKGYEKANLFKLDLFAKYKYKQNTLSLNLNIDKYPTYKLIINNLNDKLIKKFIPIVNLYKNLTLNSKYIIIKGNKNKINFYIDNANLKYPDYNLSSHILNLNGKYNIRNNNFNLTSNDLLLNIAKNSLKSNNIIIKRNKNNLNFEITNSTINYQDYNLSVIIPNLNGKYNIKNNKLQLNTKKLLLTQNDIKKQNEMFINNLNLIFNKKLFINFHTNEILNQNIINLLKKFNINIPIYQKTGKDNIFVNLTYNFINKKIDTYIKAKILNSKLMITNNNYLTIKNANLELNNSMITLKNSNLNYKKSIIDLDYYIKKGIINLDKNFIKTDGKIESLDIENIGKIKDFNESAYIDLKKISIYLKNLQTNIFIDNKTNININKLSIFYPYITYLKEYSILNGNVKINIDDTIYIKTNIKKTNQQIIGKNLIPLKTLNLTTIINDNNITIKNENFRVNIVNKNPIKIDAGFKKIDINITKFVNEALENNKTKSKQEYIFDAKGLNSNIIYKTHQLYSHKLSIHYDNKFINIQSLENDRNITLIEKNNTIKIYGFNIREKDLKKLLNINFIKNSKVNFFALETNQSSAIHGFIQINRGYIKELKSFNNIIAFINLIPSLVTFNGPGFSDKGFKIRDGHINYIYNKGILYIKNGDIKGDNLKFKFQGYIDLINKTIKMNVDATIIVKLIKDIPIVNYIILGKDGGITIKLSVSGNLDNPKVSKNLTKGIIKAPFDIIKRTLITPFRIFIKNK